MPFVNFDLSQAESRVVAVLSEDDELLSWFEQKIDVHARTASFIFGGKEESYKKLPGKEPPERHLGKLSRHAYPYGTSPRRLMLEVNTGARRFGIDINISEWRARKILEVMEEKCPKIAEVYWPAIRQIASSTRTIVTAHGRPRYFGGRLNDELFREMYSYIPQAVVSDQTKISMIKLKKKYPWLRLILEAHDAFLADVPCKYVDEIAQCGVEIMQTPIDFGQCTLSRGKLIIPCDVEIGDNYKDLVKWKPRSAA
jgi:DNA polymerase I